MKKISSTQWSQMNIRTQGLYLRDECDGAVAVTHYGKVVYDVRLRDDRIKEDGTAYETKKQATE